jgi:transaldolase
MGASFRNVGEILELAGCDLLTISPKLLEELSKSTQPVNQKLSLEKAKQSDAEKVSFDEKSFRFAFNEDPMAVDKTAEGIRKFSADIIKLEQIVTSKV